MKLRLFALGITLTGVLLAGSVFYVDGAHYAVLTQFGSPTGEPVLHPGVHFKKPWIQRAHYLEQHNAPPSLDNSFILTPVYVQYQNDSEEKFKIEAAELKRRMGVPRYVKLGFATFFDFDTPAVDLNAHLVPSQVGHWFQRIDAIVKRARDNGLVTQISVVSNLFHGWSGFRESAIRQDVRNAQWFADGWIAPEADIKDPQTIPHSIWITPSRYALPLRSRVEEAVRIVGSHLAHKMAEAPDTLASIAGDGEVELTYERNFAGAGEKLSDRKEVLWTDYSPFMVAEFRDSLRGRYDGDRSPATDDNRDGRTFNQDFGQAFTSWRLRYYDESGPIPYETYYKLSEKLPSSGRFFVDGGFDAPRNEHGDPRFWKAWLEFRKQSVANWVRDFAMWITQSPDPETGFTIPSSRFYSYQIPANFIFGQSDSLRLKTSASYLETAFIGPLGSPGITAFNGYNGKKHFMTATPALFSAIFMAGDNWGILEYNPSIPYDNSLPPSGDEEYYLSQLRQLYTFRPHLLAPFAWTDLPEHKRYSIKDSAFERGLRRFVQEVGDVPWFSWRQVLK